MRLTWFWRMLVYLVGGILSVNGDGGGGGAGAAAEVFYCTDSKCNKIFLSRSGRDKHVKRTHQIVGNTVNMDAASHTATIAIV